MQEADYTIASVPDPTPQDRQAIYDGLTAYNLQFAPPQNLDRLTLLVHDRGGALIGGLTGGTFWGWLYIELLWIAEPARGQGIGKRLLALAEQEALRRACPHVFLDTQSFQAREFYEKFGYTVFGVLDDFPVGHRRYWMNKDLAPAVHPSA